eukprot:3514144-Pyramimonas_sp.AAC.1
MLRLWRAVRRNPRREHLHGLSMCCKDFGLLRGSSERSERTWNGSGKSCGLTFGYLEPSLRSSWSIWGPRGAIL